jgi:hypothetical protein
MTAMPDAGLTRRVEQIVAWQFAPARVPAVLVLLRQQLERLQGDRDRHHDFERVLLADLKLGDGREDELVRCLSQSLIDWRDTLVAARFADDTSAHGSWFDDMRARHERPT